MIRNTSARVAGLPLPLAFADVAGFSTFPEHERATMPTRILVVDDSRAIRRSLRSYIEAQTDWQICGEAENGKVAVEMTQTLSTDVVILDLSMPVMNGLDAAREIRRIAPDVCVLMYTLNVYPRLLENANKVGIKDVLSKSRAVGSDVLNAIRSMLAA
jgi:DNA-binding NarL/FixJ family response regulator